MARQLPSVLQNSTLEERSAEFTLVTPHKGQAALRIARERVAKENDKTVISVAPSLIIGRQLSDQALLETVKLGNGKIVSMADITEALEKFADRWSQQDAEIYGRFAYTAPIK